MAVMSPALEHTVASFHPTLMRNSTRFNHTYLVWSSHVHLIIELHHSTPADVWQQPVSGLPLS